MLFRSEAGSGSLPHQVVMDVLGPQVICGALSGPSFADEVAAGRPTAVALAANNPDFARQTARQLHTTSLRIYANDDLIGVEVGGAVKNVLAIATGACDGLGLGLNSRAALITRGLAEIARLGQALGYAAYYKDGDSNGALAGGYNTGAKSHLGLGIRHNF